MKKILIAIFAAATLFACDDRMDKLNTPKTYPVEVPGEDLFTNGLREMFDMMTNTNVNENVFRLYAQYWAQTTYPDESGYNMVTRENPDNLFTNAYREALKDMADGKAFIIANPDATVPDEQELNQQLIIDINTAYVYSFLVETFGDVPFSEALDPDNLTPKYDDALTIYQACVDMLDNAIDNIDPAFDGFSEAQDPVYGGDAAMWVKFAASLKFRMGVMLIDANPTLAQTWITEALATGVISSSAENTTITYSATPPSTNPLYEDLVLSGRKDFVIANTVVDLLDSLLDPRLQLFATETMPFPYEVDPSTGSKKDSVLNSPKFLVYEDVDGEDSLVAVTTAMLPYTVLAADSTEVKAYIGGTYGTANGYAGKTKIGTMFFEPDISASIITYTELLFLAAEAVEKGMTLAAPFTGTAQELYEAGITSSFADWGLAGSAAYIASLPAYSSADYKQMIGIQAWIALYNRGYEGWTTWRRLDFDGFNIAETITTVDEIPVRFIYPIREATLNPASLTAASTAIGGDEQVTKLFWDKF
ncbi:SusD/RagB family nutrient-binding outer membrane lipoprotein [Marinoscillum sp. MHG1-6]|uniref:SusD/RagB family nutrient-binding outer membrane lipoprotein n=1 Tax=Marinoscillum sp. MHG1-6 TaxID=2959627 RepID=UPI0021588ECD|nr:SusD/RagB family nutrient-binding outer membrane lipoprotein [Marinoscillum sp. MHG1-6]